MSPAGGGGISLDFNEKETIRLILLCYNTPLLRAALVIDGGN